MMDIAEVNVAEAEIVPAKALREEAVYTPSLHQSPRRVQQAFPWIQSGAKS